MKLIHEKYQQNLQKTLRKKQYAFCSWGHVTNFFQENFYIMGYNLKKARNGKSPSKMPKWLSLNHLELKNKFIRQFEFSENLEVLFGNVAGEQYLTLQQHFPYKFPYSFKTSDCHKISSFNDGGLKFGHFVILDILFPFLAFVKL